MTAARARTLTPMVPDTAKAYVRSAIAEGRHVVPLHVAAALLAELDRVQDLVPLLPAAETPTLPPGPGEDDTDVWLSPRGEPTVWRLLSPCEYCAGKDWHIRTGRCYSCGRRPSS